MDGPILSLPCSAPDLLERGVMKTELRGTLADDLDQLLRTQYLPRAVSVHSPGNGEVIVREGMICHRPVRTAREWWDSGSWRSTRG